MDHIRDHLNKEGYAVIDQFLRQAECEELMEAGLEFTKNLPKKEERVIFSSANGESQQLKEDYFLNSNDKICVFFERDALEADGELKVPESRCLNKVGHALHLLHPMFRCYTYCDRVKSVCRALGFKEPAVVQSMYIYKNPGVGSPVLPHQDISYLYTEPTPPIGFWIALEDATIEKGCLWVIPGSHRSGVHTRLIRNSNPDDPKKLVYTEPAAPTYPESSYRPLQVFKGDCILLHGNIVHKSLQNNSNESRHAYAFHVIEKHKNNYSPQNWLQEGPNAPFLNLYDTLQY